MTAIVTSGAHVQLADGVINHEFFRATTMLGLITDGLANGAVYALLAVALVVVYRTTGQINFAQGEMAMLSAFVVYALTRAGLPIWPAILGAMVISAAGGGLVEWGIVAPLGRRGPSAAVLGTLGLFLIFDALGAQIWGVTNRSALRPFPSSSGDRFVLIHGYPPFALSYETLLTWLTLAVVVAGFWALLNRTKLGLGYRAVSANRESSHLIGIRVESMLVLGWVLAAIPGTLAGVITSQASSGLNFSMMFNVLIFSLAAATLGGFDSITGAVVGGLLVGLLESVVPNLFTFIGADLGLVVALVVITLVLLLRPRGLFGKAVVERA